MAEMKFKIGDTVKTVKLVHPWKKGDLGKVFTIRDFNPNGERTFDEPHYGLDGDTHYVWLESELELVEKAAEEPPTPEPIQVNVDITVTINYDNACWYCRKGGLVDLYFGGKLGICPRCGRVCNTHKEETNNCSSQTEVTPVKNEPLTTEEIEALPDGTRVFTLWYKNLDNKMPDWSHRFTRWRTKNGNRLEWAGGFVSVGNAGKRWDAYLVEPNKEN